MLKNRNDLEAVVVEVCRRAQTCGEQLILRQYQPNDDDVRYVIKRISYFLLGIFDLSSSVKEEEEYTVSSQEHLFNGVFEVFLWDFIAVLIETQKEVSSMGETYVKKKKKAYDAISELTQAIEQVRS